MNSPRVVVVPWPTQGHVNPLMHFSHRLAKHGIKITFVIPEFIHKRILGAMANKERLLEDQIRLVSMPASLSCEEDQAGFGELAEAILQPAKFEEILTNINATEGNDKITCVLSDPHMGWVLEVSEKMGIRGALLWPTSATVSALQMSIPRLIDEGILDNYGFPIKKQLVRLSPSMPDLDTANFPWPFFNDLPIQKVIIQYMLRYLKALKIADWWLCNTTSELEPEAFSLFPKLKPIGPLMATHQIGNSGAQFWPEDSTCLKWLDQQPARSVIYVSLGSITVLEQAQFEELARGLELCNLPFLWVVRPGLTNEPNLIYPNGFKGSIGKIVSWAPQQKVLGHPAIGCFLSHCGWNSTIEGLSHGTPFLCWPYFFDQYYNQNYICDFWRVGLKFDPDENGFISGNEIKKKVEQLIKDEKIRSRSLEIKEMAIDNITEGGGSSNNFKDFVEWLKA